MSMPAIDIPPRRQQNRLGPASVPQNFELIKVIAGLIQSELSLPSVPQRVSIYNQKWNIPATDGLFINVDFIGERVIGANTKTVDDPTESGGMIEQQYSTQQETYQVDVYSNDSSARQRKQEVVFALQSTRAQQLSEKYGFKIGHIPNSFVDMSEIEASARLNRYALTFSLIRGFSRSRRIEAFTIFQNPPELLYVNQ